MKRNALLLTLLVLLLAVSVGCEKVPLAEMDLTMPLGHVLGENASTEAAHSYEGIELYGVSGTAGYHYLTGKLYSFTFASSPDEEGEHAQYDILLENLSEVYGKPSATSDEGVSIWAKNKLGNVITLTLHEENASEDGYVSLAFSGKYDALTELGMVADTEGTDFPEESALSSLLDCAPSEVIASLGTPTESALDEAGTGAVVYDGFLLGERKGVLQVAFYEERSYSAVFSLSSLTGECSAEDYYELVADTRSAHKAPSEEYCLGYADDEGVSQTQYQMWKNVNNKFTAELVYFASPEGDVLQYGLTASWMLSNRPAMQAVMGD